MKLEFDRLYGDKLFYHMNLTDMPMYALCVSERLAKFICSYARKWHVKYLKLDWEFYYSDMDFYPYAISLKSNVVLICLNKIQSINLKIEY